MSTIFKIILLIVVGAFLGAAAQSYWRNTRGPTPVDSAVASALGREDPVEIMKEKIEQADKEVDRLMDKAKETVEEVVK